MEEEIIPETFDKYDRGLKEDAIIAEEPPPKPIPVEELIEKQKEEIMCRQYAATVGLPNPTLTGTRT